MTFLFIHKSLLQVKEAHATLRQEAYDRRKMEKEEKMTKKIAKTMQYEMSEKVEHKRKSSKKSLASRLEAENESEMVERKDGHQMVFREKKSRKQLMQEERERQHRQERQEVRRSASGLKKDRIKPKFYRGKRII